MHFGCKGCYIIATIALTILICAYYALAVGDYKTMIAVCLTGIGVALHWQHTHRHRVPDES